MSFNRRPPPVRIFAMSAQWQQIAQWTKWFVWITILKNFMVCAIGVCVYYAIAHISARSIEFFFLHTKCQLAQVIIFSVTEKCVCRRDLVWIRSHHHTFHSKAFYFHQHCHWIPYGWDTNVLCMLRLKETHLERSSLMMKQHEH